MKYTSIKNLVLGDLNQKHETNTQLFPGANVNFWTRQSSQSLVQARILEVNSFAMIILQVSARKENQVGIICYRRSVKLREACSGIFLIFGLFSVKLIVFLQLSKPSSGQTVNT